MASAPYHYHAGFSALEAMVGLVLLATLMLPLLALQQSSTRAAFAVQRSEQILLDDRAALGLVSRTNPFLQPEGEERLGTLVIRWQSRPIAPPRAALGSAGGPGRFQVQRFQIQVEIVRGESAPRQWVVERMAWRPTRPVAGR